jgi:hypothetical protein
MGRKLDHLSNDLNLYVRIIIVLVILLGLSLFLLIKTAKGSGSYKREVEVLREKLKEFTINDQVPLEDNHPGPPPLPLDSEIKGSETPIQ